MIVRVGDEQAAGDRAKAERMLQPRGITDPVHVAELEQITTRDRADLVLRRQRHGADDVGLGVGHVEFPADQRQSGGLGKGRLVDVPVVSAFGTGAGIADHHAPQ